LLINLLEKSKLGSLAKVELSTELVNDLLWELSLVDLDVLDVLSTVKLDLEDADWLLLLLSLLVEVVSGLGALLNLGSIVASLSSRGVWLRLIVLVVLGSWLVLAETVRWILLSLWSSGLLLRTSGHGVPVSIDHLLWSSANGVSLAYWGSRCWLHAAELVLAWSWGESSWWGLLWSHLLLLLWVEWSLWLSRLSVLLWLSVGCWLSEWVLLHWLLLHHWSLLNLLRSIHWLLLLNWSLLHNLSWRLLLHLLWLSVSLGGHGSLLLHGGVSLCSSWLWLIVNWLLLGELSLNGLLLGVWGETVLISWSLSRVLWVKSFLVN
jgi:hypothetical protein